MWCMGTWVPFGHAETAESHKDPRSRPGDHSRSHLHSCIPFIVAIVVVFVTMINWLRLSYFIDKSWEYLLAHLGEADSSWPLDWWI